MIAKFEENAKMRNDSVMNQINIPKKYQASDEISRWINKRKNDITLQDFRIKAKLGQGAFGSVFLVQLQNNDDAPDKKLLFAMKVMNKQMIYSQNMEVYTKDCPFVTKMYFAFQNAKNFFLLLEYCEYGDLGNILKREKRFTEAIARQYIC